VATMATNSSLASAEVARKMASCMKDRPTQSRLARYLADTTLALAVMAPSDKWESAHAPRAVRQFAWPGVNSVKMALARPAASTPLGSDANRQATDSVF
jgi:hypothetical protein